MKKKKTQRKKLIEKLEKTIREYILLRDKNRCVWCGKSVSGCNAHVSHVIPRSKGNRLKYVELNLKLLCFHCHLNKWHKDPLEGAEWFKSTYPKINDFLQEHKNEYFKITDSYLEEIEAKYKQKIKELGK